MKKFIIGADVKNDFNNISFIKNENSIEKSNNNSLLFINFGTIKFIQFIKLNFLVASRLYNGFFL